MTMRRIGKLAIPSKTVPYRAMILAAGRGERMRPLTDTIPKPLLQAGEYRLIEYQIHGLVQAGFKHIVINHAYLGAMIEEVLGNGSRYDAEIIYSPEQVVLETAGGIANALPLLTDDHRERPILVVNADIYCEYDYATLLPVLQDMYTNCSNRLAHLVLVDNPQHHAAGDFALEQDRVARCADNCLTFSGIGVYHPLLFREVAPKTPAKLAPLLHAGIDNKCVTGEYYPGVWFDIGTPDRLEQLDKKLKARSIN